MKTMLPYPGAGYQINAYQATDLPKLQDPIDCAKTLWRDRCQTYLDKNGDMGTCVLGAGIVIDYLGPRCRTPRRKTIIAVSQVCNAQGSLVWEDSVKEVVEYLKSRGVEAHYAPGNMD
jgi:hypothetical protein